MDVKNINPVINAFTEIATQLGFKKIERTELTAVGPILQNRGLIINIDVLDQLRGTIIINMDNEAAKKFASKMMMGMAVSELDEMAQSAIAEFGNMVCAHACTNFAKIGLEQLNISPPIIIKGANGRVKLLSPVSVVVKYQIDDLPVEICVGLLK